MSFLPIVGRELHVAARRGSTYWTRSGAALLATGLAVWIFETSALVAGPGAGGRLFALLSTFAWAACLTAGVFLTADCLSEEKRLGTLGLLFLTDLRPWDIVLGKLVASSLHGFYALLAIVPVLALPLIFGGVNWWEFAGVSVGLCVTLLFSLSLGMWSSAVHRRERPSMATTALVLVVWALLPALLPGWRVISPLGLHLIALGGRSASPLLEYMAALGTVTFLSLVFLWRASKALPVSWQDDPVVAPGSKAAKAAKAANAAARGNKAGIAGLLDVNPAAWLFSRHCSGGLVRVVTLLGASFLICFWIANPSQWWLMLILVSTIHACLKLCMAWEASRLLDEHQRAGGLELVLVSRVSVAELLDGGAATLRRLFRSAIMLVIGLDVISAGVVLASSLRAGATWGRNDLLTPTVFTGLVLLGMLLADLWALTWMGMWFGLHHRQPWRAALSCVLRLFVLPWVLPVGALLLSGGSAGGLAGLPVALFLAWIVCSFVLAYALGSSSKQKIHNHLRDRISAPSGQATAGLSSSL